MVGSSPIRSTSIYSAMKKVIQDVRKLQIFRDTFTIILALITGFILNRLISDLLPFYSPKIPDIRFVQKNDRVEKPNIVLILLDDLDDTITPFWEAMPVTKKLIKDQGMTFTNSFSPNPLCCPARASLLTGKYSHNTGVFNNDGREGGWKKFYEEGNEKETVALYLQKAGYTTSHIGKYLNGIEDEPTHVPVGWSEWYGAVGRAMYTGYNYKLNENGTLVDYGNKPEDYMTDVISQKAREFITRSESNDETSFFLSLAPTAPHYPLPPAPRHRNHPFKNSILPSVLNYDEKDISDKPDWLEESAVTRSIFLKTVNWDYRNRMGSLYAVDEMIASIIETLYKNRELENTYIIFTSDNGYNNGSHRLIQKMAPYEESQRVSLVIAGPGIKKSSDKHFALTIDLAPTILDLTGIKIPETIDGMSLAPLLFGEKINTWRKDYIAEHKIGGLASEFNGYPFIVDFVTKFIDVPSYIALRSEDYLYIEWELENKKEYELYDMKADPYQLNNLLGSEGKKYKDIVENLKERLKFLKDCKGETCR